MEEGSTGPPHSFMPPRMTNRQALDLRKQAAMGHANQHHHLGAVQEDAMACSIQECSRMSLTNSSSEQDHAAVPGVRHKVALGSWESYWDSRQPVRVPGRCAAHLAELQQQVACMTACHGLHDSVAWLLAQNPARWGTSIVLA
jgi:hypothetical protein